MREYLPDGIVFGRCGVHDAAFAATSGAPRRAVPTIQEEACLYQIVPFP